MKSIIFGDAPVTILDSLYITIVSMSIVFLVLLLIAYSLTLLKFVNFEKKQDSKNDEKKVDDKTQSIKKEENTYENTKVIIKDDLERLAVITATIAMSEEIGHSNIRVRRVERIV